MKIKELISAMTLEEKAGLCSGMDFWYTKAVDRLGIKPMMVSDGPHGLRKQDEKADHLGVNESIKAVCFPAGCAGASSFDKQLIFNMGQALDNECQAEGVGVIPGPAVNIKRSPLCGRNFEYYSEDPLVSSEIAAAFINGVQSQNVGTSIKHFLANNQEHRRMSSSSQVDERTLREIYLAAFEGAVKKAKPWTVMCSYNKINGIYAAENKKFLTDILRDEWGFDGFVMSDWGAVNNRPADLAAGMDLEMPWIDDVSAVLEMYLGGRAVGGATVNLLFGKANPSGHLAETFPLKPEDNPSYLYYTGEGDVTEYREGVFVGYRYYDKKKMPVLFPFGHGLSYTEFRYSGIKLSRQSITENDLLTVTAEITNTGKVAGKEVVQLYVGTKDSDVIRPVRELKAFEKVYLEPGQTKTVIFTLDKRAFSYFDMGINDWFVESKDYEISLGSSSRDLRLCAVVAVKGLKRKKMVYTADSTFGDVAANPANRQIVEQIMAASANSRLGGGGDTRGRISGEMMAAMLRYMPLRGLALFGFVDSLDTVDRLVEKLNRANN